MKKSKTICSTCRLIKKADCDRCKPKAFEGIKKTNYSLYNSRKWRNYALALRKRFPLCELCIKEGRTTPSQMVDHKKTINSGGSIWSEDNLQCLCNSCHNIKSGKDRKG